MTEAYFLNAQDVRDMLMKAASTREALTMLDELVANSRRQRDQAIIANKIHLHPHSGDIAEIRLGGGPH